MVSAGCKTKLLKKACEDLGKMLKKSYSTREMKVNISEVVDVFL